MQGSEDPAPDEQEWCGASAPATTTLYRSRPVCLQRVRVSVLKKLILLSCIVIRGMLRFFLLNIHAFTPCASIKNSSKAR